MINHRVWNKNSRRKSERLPQPGNPGDADQPAQASVPTLNVEVTILLKYLINFWGYLDLSLMKCEVELDLLWTRDYILVKHHNNITEVNFIITSAKFTSQ